MRKEDIMNINMKYLTVDAPKCTTMLWVIMAFGIFAVFCDFDGSGNH
jgi:hypothetical protein